MNHDNLPTNASQSGIVELALDKLRIDPEIQQRAGMNRDILAAYGDALGREAQFPAVIVFHDGEGVYWLADGFHRVQVFQTKGRTTIRADVRQGSRRDAILYAAGANAAHGLQRSNEDKRRAVLTLLQDSEWGAWSDREIAKRCNVSNTFTSDLRKELTVNVDSDDDSNGKPVTKTTRVFTSKHGTRSTMKTAKIGKHGTKRKKQQLDLSSPTAPFVSETADSKMAEPVVPAAPSATTAPLPVSVPNATPVTPAVPSSAKPAEPTTTSPPPSTSPAPAEQVTSSSLTTKLPGGQWRDLLNRLTDHFRPIATETGRLYTVKPEERDVRLIQELVAKVRAWANHAERTIAVP